MKKTTINSFVKGFIALIAGDNAQVLAEKAWRQANSALTSQIASREGDKINYDDMVITAQEDLNNARVNYGKPITDRNSYIELLITKKNAVISAEKRLKEFDAITEFLKEQHEELRKESGE